MTSPSQPQQVILNSKYKSSNEPIHNVTYNFATPIQNAIGARITSFSTIYLAKLIQYEQAFLTFSVRTDTVSYDYNIDLAGISENYYSSQKDLFDDINAVLTAVFTSATPGDKFYTGMKPTLVFDKRKLRTVFTANSSYLTSVLINSTNENIWFKLGYPNGTYNWAASIQSPNPPSVIPLNELYIQIDGMINETGILNNVNNPTNNPTTCEIITMNNVSLGDVFLYRPSNIPEYPLKPNTYISALNIKLLNSLGQPARLDADYRIQIDFIY